MEYNLEYKLWINWIHYFAYVNIDKASTSHQKHVMEDIGFQPLQEWEVELSLAEEKKTFQIREIKSNAWNGNNTVCPCNSKDFHISRIWNKNGPDHDWN